MVGFSWWVGLLLGVWVVDAIHYDQAGVNDWHLQHVGSPLGTIHFKDQYSSLIYVHTDQNYIAALDSSNGSLVWRRSPNNFEITRKISLEQGMLWAISQLENRIHLRFFDPKQGGLLWEHRLKSPAIIPSVKTCSSKASNTFDSTNVELAWLSSTEYLTLNQYRVITLSKIGTSKPIWIWEPNNAQEIVTKMHRESNKVYAVGVLSQTSQVFLYVIDEANGKVLNFKLFEDFTNEASQFQIVKGDVPYVIWAKAQCGDTKSLNLEAVVGFVLNEKALTDAPIQHLIDSDNNKIPFTKFSLLSFNGPDFYLQYTQFEITNTITFVIENGQIKATGFHQIQEKILDFTEQNGQLVYLSLVDDSTSKLPRDFKSLKLSFPQNVTNDRNFRIRIDPHIYGKIQFGFLQFENESIELTLLTYDGSIHHTKGDDELSVVWHREESLAKSSQSVMIELPDSHLWTQAEIEHDLVSSGFIHRYLHRLSNNFNSLINLPFSQREVHADIPVNAIPTRDRLGLRKFIIIATSSGKLLALDSLNQGTTVWSRCVACYQSETILKIVSLRTSDIKLPPVLGVVIKNSENQVKLLRIDGFSGLDLTSALPPFQVWRSFEDLQQIVTLPLVDPVEGTKVLAFISRNNEVDLIPSSPKIISSFQELPQSIHSFHSQNNSLSGFAIESGESNKILARPVWHSDFRNDHIFGFVLSSYCQVASPGRIMKDRRVLYKYINPNLAAFATFNDNQLYVHVIDVISGLVLHEASHPTTKPDSFHAVISDNTILYQYWDPYVSKAFVSVILELFEDSQPDTRHSRKSTFSSFTSHIPYVASRAYVIDNGVSALGVTQTRNGVTNRDFLFAVHSANHILGVPGHYLDALRSYDKVPNQVEAEGTVPYHPVIVFQPKAVLSYDLDVSGIKHLITSSVTYESTTLVLGYGLDVFVTSYAPSQQFDVLQPDFSKSALLATVLALIIGITISSPMLQQKKLREQWA